MKEIDLEESIRKAAHVNRNLYLPTGERTSRNWPLCLTCGREVDAAFLENVNNTSCEVRGLCHGKEDFFRIKWKVPVHGKSSDDILDDPNVGWAIKRAMSDACFFDPRHSDFNFSSKRT